MIRNSSELGPPFAHCGLCCFLCLVVCLPEGDLIEFGDLHWVSVVHGEVESLVPRWNSSGIRSCF